MLLIEKLAEKCFTKTERVCCVPDHLSVYVYVPNSIYNTVFNRPEQHKYGDLFGYILPRNLVWSPAHDHCTFYLIDPTYSTG